MPRAVELDVMDELMLLLNNDETPLNVQCEVRVEGRLDADRLSAAVRAAALRHPLARASLPPPRARDWRLRWLVSDDLEAVPLEVVDCEDDAALARTRERLLRGTPPLDRPGPFLVGLAHHPSGDAIVLNFHHGVGDGVSAFRFMTSIVRAYAGVEDPLPPVDPIAVRDIRGLIGTTLESRLTRARGAAADYLRRVRRPPARLALPAAGDRGGYGFDLFELSVDEVEEVFDRAPRGATLNDVMLGGLAVALRRWNERHGGGTGDVYLMMPVNLRPSEWSLEVFGNFAPWTGVRLARDEQADIATATEATAARGRSIKEGGVAGALVDLSELLRLFPYGVKRHLAPISQLASRITVDTAELSNMGQVKGVPRELGDAGAIRAFWGTPPGWPQLGASFSLAAFDARLFVGLRYLRAYFDAERARELAQLYRATLLGAPDGASAPAPDARRLSVTKTF